MAINTYVKVFEENTGMVHRASGTLKWLQQLRVHLARKVLLTAATNSSWWASLIQTLHPWNGSLVAWRWTGITARIRRKLERQRPNGSRWSRNKRKEGEKMRLLIVFNRYQLQTMKAILGIIGGQLALAAGCTNLIEIAEEFKQTGQRTKTIHKKPNRQSPKNQQHQQLKRLHRARQRATDSSKTIQWVHCFRP